MAEEIRCSRCGEPMEQAVAGTRCPACLFRAGLEGDDAGETLLAAPGAGETVLTPRPDAAATGLGRPATGSRGQSTPTNIGPYRLVKPIGEGGMGVVYLAEQDEPIRRTVALKLIKLGMDTHEVVSRFEAERQALALMEHPNVASVLDAGATADGRPYFVMEYVPGLPITEYCDARRLDTRQRLALFILVCNAIQHAHQKGIIHRDLKPSNVLVLEQDGAPVPKVIDFGIAKATDQRLTQKTMFTQHGMLIGTPEYMSPEQADPAGVDVDTRSDIYSLGVVLYELLVGSVPFPGTRLREAGYTELIRIIREEEPAKPSTRLTTAVTSAELAERRHTNVPSLTQELRGDLDWTTLRALEKDRTRRYPSVSEFAADLTRYLNHEPVVARPPSVSYRVQKFVRRNRLAVTAASLITLAVLGGLIVSSVLYVKEGRARRDAVAQRTEAVSQRDRADEATRTAIAKAESEARQRAVAEAATQAEAAARDREAAQRGVAERALTSAETRLYLNNIDLADREIAAGNIRHVDQLLAMAPAALRNWEWHYLSRLSHMETDTIDVPGAGVMAMAQSADGTRVLTASRDMTVVAWDTRTRRQTSAVTFRPAGASEAITVVFSADGSTVAGQLNRLNGVSQLNPSVWDAATGQPRFTVPLLDATTKMVTRIAPTAFALSPDGRLLVAAALETNPESADRAANTVRTYALQAWDTRTGTRLGNLRESATALGRPTFSPDGGRLAVMSGGVNGNHSVDIVDAASGHNLAQIVLPGTASTFYGPVGALAFSRDGGLVAAGFVGQSPVGGTTAYAVGLWDAADGKELWTSPISRSPGRVTFSPDGTRVVIALSDNTIRVLDRASGKEQQRLVGHDDAIVGVTFTPDGRRLISAASDKTVRFWDLDIAVRTQAMLEAGPTSRTVQTATASGDGRMLLARTAATLSAGPAGVIGGQGVNLEGWDLLTGRHVFAVPAPNFGMPVSANGARAVLLKRSYVDTGGGNVAMRMDFDVLDVRSGTTLTTLRQPGIAGTAVPQSMWEEQVRKTRQELPVLSESGFSATGNRFFAVFSRLAQSNPQRVAPNVAPHEVVIWDVTSGAPTVTIAAPNTQATRCAFSPNAAQVAIVTEIYSSGGDQSSRELRLYDTTTGRMIRTMQRSTNVEMRPVLVFSPDGRQVAATTTDGSVTLWDTVTGERRLLMPLSGRISSMAFSPDATRLVMGGGSITMWNALTGNQMLTLTKEGLYTLREQALQAKAAAAGTSQTVAFSADGRQVIWTQITLSATATRVQVFTFDGSPKR